MFNTTSCAIGCDDRMKDSLQQVHSSPCSQITGMRGLVSMASTTWGTAAADSPMAAVVQVQNFKNSLRSMPCFRSTS